MNVIKIIKSLTDSQLCKLMDIMEERDLCVSDAVNEAYFEILAA